MEVQLRALLERQDDMNRSVDPNWRNQKYEYYRAAWIECAELMDHFGYKWWKKQDSDMNQVRLEIVDILHFILSIYLLRESEYTPIVEHLMMMAKNFKYNCSGVLENTESMVKILLTPDHPHLFEAFLNLMTSAGMTFSQTYRLYIGKNVLNFFRQNNGYKDGTYTKIWNEREDNEHLTDIMTSLDSDCPSFSKVLYDKLEDRYREIVSN